MPNGFDINKLRPDRDAKPQILRELRVPNTHLKSGDRNGAPFFIGLIARYDPMKGHETFINAACHLLQERNDIHFILAGRGVEWKNRELANRIPTTFQNHFHRPPRTR